MEELASPGDALELAGEGDAFALLDALFADAPVGLAFWDRELRYRRVNHALAAMNGRSVAEHLGRTPEEVLGELGVRLRGLLTEILTTGQPVLDQAVSGQTDAEPGVERHWRASYYPVPGREGRALGIGTVVVEVTAEHRADRRARRARRDADEATAILDALVDSAPVGIGFLDRDLRYQRLNQALAALNGQPPEAHLGRTPAEVLGAAGETVAALLRQVTVTRRPALDVELTAPLPGRGEAEHHLQASYFPIPGPRGDLLGVGGMVRDVTAERRAEAERADLLARALGARAQAEAAQVRAEAARCEAERAQRAVEAAHRRTRFLADAGALLGTSLDYETTLRQVARAAVPEIADWCVIHMVQRDGELRRLAAVHADPERQRLAEEMVRRWPPRSEAEHGPARVVRTGQRELIPEIPDALVERAARDPEHLRRLRELGLRSSLVVPLRTGGRTLGALSLVVAESPRRFGPDDVALAEALAALAARAAENARLYAERSHIARTLQRSLLPPHLPTVPGLDLAARYRAAGDHEVGGDFYDVFPCEEGVWTAVIGDVSGKGADAAALTSLSRHALRTAALREPEPVANLRLLNEALLHSDPRGRFLTAIYARLLPSDDGALVRLASGGHPPPLLLRAGGGLERVPLAGTLIGAFPDPTFAERSLRLRPGDVMVLHTDGVTELRGVDPEVGERRLADTLVRLRGASAGEVAEAVVASAVGFQGGEPRDDIAVLVLRAAAGADA
jgi:PAS domain S-box-containing protein